MSAAAVHRGPVKVKVGDKEWTIIADINALCDFQDATGVTAASFLRDLDANGDDVDVKLLREFVRATLLEHHPDATLRDAGKVMNADPKAYMRAIDAAFPDAPKDGEAAPGEDQAATG